MGRPPSPEHAGRVRVLFSNPDLLWSNEFPTGRFGQGAFQTAVKALHEEVCPRTCAGRCACRRLAESGGVPMHACLKICDQDLQQLSINGWKATSSKHAIA